MSKIGDTQEMLKALCLEDLQKCLQVTLSIIRKNTIKNDDVFLLNCQFQNINKKTTLNTIDDRVATVEINKIQASILNIINSIKSGDLTDQNIEKVGFYTNNSFFDNTSLVQYASDFINNRLSRISFKRKQTSSAVYGGEIVKSETICDNYSFKFNNGVVTIKLNINEAIYYRYEEDRQIFYTNKVHCETTNISQISFHIEEVEFILPSDELWKRDGNIYFSIACIGHKDSHLIKVNFETKGFKNKIIYNKYVLMRVNLNSYKSDYFLNVDCPMPNIDIANHIVEILEFIADEWKTKRNIGLIQRTI